MFEALETPQPDAILQLSVDYAADPRPEKIDLGVGVFKDETGATPILDAVHQAEEKLLTSQTSKTYVGLLGDVGFNDAMTRLILGEDAPIDRIGSLQTPGGSAALRMGFDLIKRSNPTATVWVPTPTWANHVPIIESAGLKINHYPYLDLETRGVDFTAMMKTLENIPAGDVLLLHGCCHNPAGADLSNQQWNQISRLSLSIGFFPLVDLAYQGFGDGLNEDAYGVRKLAATLPELMITASCSKNFAIYRERTGIAVSLSRNKQTRDNALGQMTSIARAGYSMPPDHGAAVVRTILEDPALRSVWETELGTMRDRINSMRQKLADTFKSALGDDRFEFLTNDKGMFSMLPLSVQQVQSLRETHAIYMAGTGRINVAGLRTSTIEPFVQAVKSVL